MAVISLTLLKSTVHSFLKSRRLSDAHALLIADDLIEAELEGKVTHGLGKLFLIDDLMAARQGSPVVTRKYGSVELIDARRELGQIAGQLACERAVALASMNGVGVVAIANMARYARLSFLGRKVADAGLVGIIANDAGPSAVAPAGGSDPILGTNPMCFAFPSEPPLIIDFTTSERPWGAIRQALLSGESLPARAFIDADGNDTTDPNAANAVRAFGGVKGYALCLALELLCGGLVTGIVGTEVNSEYELGSLVVALLPSAFGTHDIADVVQRMRTQLTGSRGAPRVPGDSAHARRNERTRSGTVEVADTTWQSLLQMINGGGRVLDVSNKTN